MWIGSTNEIGLLRTIQAKLATVLAGAPRRQGDHVLLVSDYGGTHKGSHFQTYSFLAIDLPSAWVFLEECKQIRSASLGRRKMAYKNLNDVYRQRVLIQFLRAANTLNGLLVTFAIESTIDSLFEENWNDVYSELPGLNSIKVSTLRKLFLVGHLGAISVCPWLSPGTHLTWITDDDDFTFNPSMIRSSTSALGAIISEHALNDLGHFKFGAASYVDVGRQSEDMLALADLSCGTVSDTAHLWHILAEGESLGSNRSLKDMSIKEKAQVIAGWLAFDNSFTLKKVVLRIRRDTLGRFVCDRMKAECEPMPHFDPSEVLDRYFG
ncbi:MAG TPA: hypothetical protein VG944_20850 [Fimbriimonas sp.]|nr:hypothetical protein [Fimbriimonas sp.]